MNVAHVLAVKGHSVVTVQPHRTLLEAARTLSEYHIGAAVVAGHDGAILGIISERDIVRAVSAHGAGALDSAVSRFMTEKVVTCDEDAMMSDVMDVMTTGKFRHLPVVHEGRLTGIISIGDVVKHRIDALASEQDAMRSYITMS